MGEWQEEQRPQSKAAALREKLLRLEAQAKEEDKQEKGEVSSNATTVMTDDIPDDADPPHVIICASGEACNSKRTADKNALINFFEDEENPGTWYCEACWGEDEEQAEDAEDEESNPNPIPTPKTKSKGSASKGAATHPQTISGWRAGKAEEAGRHPR